MQPALLIAGHGSRDAEGTGEFLRLVEMLRAAEPGRVVEAGFLEFARPVIAEAAGRCAARGAEEVVVLPGMLTAAGHAKNDVPSEVQEARRLNPGVRFHYGRHLHLHPAVLELCRLRVEEAERAAPGRDRADALLLVAGRGSSDPDANADVAKFARLLGEGMGFGWSAVCYAGVASPPVPEALRRCAGMGFGRIVVLPFFLFTGVLEKRIRRQAAEFAETRPGVEVVCAGHLGAHPLLCEAFAERAEEALYGSPNMNCELCKYRVRLPGYEAALGQPQAGHHHHVRANGHGGEP